MQNNSLKLTAKPESRIGKGEVTTLAEQLRAEEAIRERRNNLKKKLSIEVEAPPSSTLPTPSVPVRRE